MLKPTAAPQYADTAGSDCRFEAEWLKNTGLFTGEQLGGQLCFQADKTVSQEEFLVMMVKALGIPTEEAVNYAGFEEVPQWLKPCLSAAAANAVPAGTWEEAPVFNWDAPITDRQAALLLDALMDLTDVACSGDASAQAETNLEACRIMSFTEQEHSLTWGEAARILASAGAFLENRE